MPASATTGLDISEMLLGDATRLRYVQRFSTCHRVHDESVAEHSYYVALYAMLIADWCNNFWPGTRISLGEVLRRAVLHDLEEAVTGDVNRTFKYSNDELLQAMHRAGHDAFVNIVSGITASGSLLNVYSRIWATAKDDTPAGRIIAFADYLSVLSYMIQELTHNNVTMRRHWETMNGYLGLFDDPSYDFIRPLVTQARLVFRTAFAAGDAGAIT